MDDEATGRLLQKVEPVVFCIAVGIVFLSIQISAYPVLYLLLWVFAGGVVFGYMFFRMVPLVPNILFHLRVPHTKLDQGGPNTHVCSLCGSSQCKTQCQNNCTFPWNGLTVPQTVDSALTEFLEVILKRFIYSWQRNLLSDECLVDEVRFMIRHALAALLRRARKLSIPSLLTTKLLRVAAAHMHICVQARRTLPANADTMAVQEAILRHYGNKRHVALGGATGNVRYFRHLCESLLPFLLPEDAMKSKVVKSFVQELFASKVLGPAMQTVSNPDFIDLIILKICDPNSRLTPTYGPRSQEIHFLARFGSRRSTTPLPLAVTVEQVITTSTYLTPFTHFMESKGQSHILEAYLTISALRTEVASLDMSLNESPAVGFMVQRPRKALPYKEWADHHISTSQQLSQLYQRHIHPHSTDRAIFDDIVTNEIAEVMDSEKSDVAKLNKIIALNILQRLFQHIHRDMENIHCLQFHQSSQFYDVFLRHHEDNGTLDGWKHRHAPSSWPSIGSDLDVPLPVDSVDASSDREEEEEKEGEEEEGEERGEKHQEVNIPAALEQTVHPHTDSLPYQIKVVDWKCLLEGHKGKQPYIIYYIQTTIGDQVNTVKRRFREFEGLDTRLRQFYGSIPAALPRKKLNNMDITFIKNRVTELEIYLTSLLTVPKVQSSSLLHTFLTNTEDTSLFMPDSVTGKMMKAVEDLTKDKPVYIEDFLHTIQGKLAFPPRQSSAQEVAKAIKLTAENASKVQAYQEAISHDLQMQDNSVGITTGDSLSLNGVMDLIVYMAVHVYNVTRWQLLSLFCLKYIFQNTLQSFVHHFIEYKVSLMSSETEIVNLIGLLQHELFPEKPHTPRSSSEVLRRKTDALTTLLRYPPELFVELVGVDRFKEGTSILFEALQCSEVNKQLLFSLFDVIVLELFPELAGDGDADH